MVTESIETYTVRLDLMKGLMDMLFITPPVADAGTDGRKGRREIAGPPPL